MMGSNQPLSPTHMTASIGSNNTYDKSKDGVQKALKGIPQYVGLSQIDYSCEEKIFSIQNQTIHHQESISNDDIALNYISSLYDEKASLQISQSGKIDLLITLPYEMLIEQIEISLLNSNLFKKYIKLLKIQKLEDKQFELMSLKGGFIDYSAKTIEINTCGYGQTLKLTFIYDKMLVQEEKKNSHVSSNEQMMKYAQSKGQMTSEKLKNEILPLLNNGSDDDIDELDDEVAMISHKKDASNGRKDEISSEDIQIQFKSEYSNKQSQNRKNLDKQQPYKQQPPAQKGLNSKDQNEESKKSDDPENTRNFNTLPRNYSDSMQRNSLKLQMNGLEGDKMLIEDNGSKESITQEQLMNGVDNIAHLEQIIFAKGHNARLQDNWFIALITRAIKSIKVTGFNANSIPAITNMTLFMNESFYLKKEKMTNDSLEVDFLVGVLMISNKRYTQASEIFRRIQTAYIKQIELKIKEQKSNPNQQSSPRNLILKSQLANLASSNQVQQEDFTKLYHKCALLELLVVESMCSATQLNDKLASIKRMIDFFMLKLAPPNQFQQQIFFSEDPYTTMIKILPYLLKFVIMCLTHKKEVIKLAALKLLEFILETQGCSLDAAMVLILKAILKTYPGIQLPNQINKDQKQQQIQQESFCVSVISSNASDYLRSPRGKSGREPVEKNAFNNTMQLKFKNPPLDKVKGDDKKSPLLSTEYSTLKEPSSGFSQAMKNAYNHALDTYISVLSSISSHILHQLFYEVIIQCLTTPSTAINTQTNTALTAQNLQSINEIKIFSVKIAEKIITICQGDLLLNKYSLDQLLMQVVTKGSSNGGQGNENLQLAVKNLWQNIKTKVFANYSLKGMKGLIDWLVEKMTLLAQSGQKSVHLENSNKSNGGSDLAKLEISEEETYQLQQLLDIVSLISIGKKKNEEEANNLIKIKQEYCVNLYLLINPLLFWLDFSVEREERLNLFKVIYQTIKDVLENLPPKKGDLDILQIMIPILQKTTEYLKTNSPSLSMLKFLDMVLRDIKAGGFCTRNPDLQYFFLDMLNNFVNYISYSLYEEVFAVFDKLLVMCADVINEKVVQKCIVALVDKYTMKSKSHKNSVQAFMKCLLEVKVTNYHQQQKEKLSHRFGNNNNNMELDEQDLDEDQLSIHSKNNYFEILTEFCFFGNEDPALAGSGHPQTQNKQVSQSNDILKKCKNPVDTHDLYIDKLQFFIDTLGQLNEMHINIFTQLIMNPKFKSTLIALLGKGETQLRLKCHEILEIVTNYYVQYCTSKTVYELAVPSSAGNDGQKRKNNTQNEVMEVEFINHERLYMSQIVVNCVKASLEQKNDSYLQFNSLILLDFLFQNLLPVPSYQNEYLKGKGVNTGGSKSNQNQSSEKFGKNMIENMLDIENLEINENTPEFEVTDERYLHMRINLVFKLWPYIQQALNSAWSNIRSICYGLICSMLKIDLRDFQHSEIKSAVNPNSNANQQQNMNAVLIKLKQLILPMLLSLLSSKESESKAGGLNILGSFCGLSYDFSKVKISKNLEFFKKNSNFVSLGIWQLVFDLQDDWDITIKEASVVLIQLCAPRDAVKYFDKGKRERDNLKFANILNRYAVTPGGGHSSQSSRNQFYLNSGTSNEEEFQMMQQPGGDPLKQNLMSFLSGTDDLSMVLQLDQQIAAGAHQQQDMFDLHSQAQQQQYIQNLKIQSQRQVKDDQHHHQEFSKKHVLDYESALLNDQVASSLTHQNFQEQLGADMDILAEIDGTLETFQFFVDEYSDDQIQEIISIFRNDFKPPKNLWIEKNPSAAFNAPDYYAEIYSQAIEQFNQQQMQLQQQQQQELQMKVSNSPKAASGSGQSIKNGLLAAIGAAGPSQNIIVDALEDDLVKRYENEKKEKDRIKSNQLTDKSGNQSTGGAKQQQDNYMIFERHFEEGKETKVATETKNVAHTQINIQTAKEDLGSIDAEPYKFLGGDSPSDSDEFFPQSNQQQTQKPASNKIDSKPVISTAQINLQESKSIATTQVKQQVDESESLVKDLSKNKEDSSQQKQMDSQKTDELIEQYERKINKTIQLLEEEKKKTSIKSNKDTLEDQGIKNESQANTVGSGVATANAGTVEANSKSTPEFKQKNNMKIQDNNQGAKEQANKQKKQNQQAALQLSELSRGYINNIDNMKLIKQINNVFNDTSLSYQSNIFVPPQKTKQKLNKSFENVMAAQKSNLKGVNTSSESGGGVNQAIQGVGANVVGNKNSKKNLSSSPRRGSSSGKKSGMGSKSQGSGGGGYNNKKKYIVEQSKQMAMNNANGNGKALYNMRDLNFFIKTIEKDLSEKFNKMSLKDFNSMPTTPTSILKKVEDQVKALQLKKDQKAYMSNTCPNMAQILGSLDNSQSSKSNQVLQISNITNQSQAGVGLSILDSKGATSDVMSSSVIQTPSSNYNMNMFGSGDNNHGVGGNLQSQYQGKVHQYQQYMMNQNQNPTNKQDLEKLSFSKTQKIDLNSINKNIFGYSSNNPFNHQNHHHKEDYTQRDSSNDSQQFGKHFKISPKIEEKSLYTNLLKQNKNLKQSTGKHSKRSRGSQDKYGLSGQGMAMLNNMQNQPQASTSSSQSKLNKSANMINPGHSNQIGAKVIKKQQLSKSFIEGHKSHNQTEQSQNNNQSPHLTLMQQQQQQQLLQINMSPQSQKKTMSYMYQTNQAQTSNQISTQVTTLQQTPIQFNPAASTQSNLYRNRVRN